MRVVGRSRPLSDDDEEPETAVIQARSREYYEKEGLRWFNDPNAERLMGLSGKFMLFPDTNVIRLRNCRLYAGAS